MIVNLVHEFYAKCNRTVVILRDEWEAQRLLDGGLAAAGLSTKGIRFATRFRCAQGSFGKFGFRTDGSEAELDRREIGDAQRSKRDSTSSSIPCKETEVDGRLQRISPVCQDLMTDPYSPILYRTLIETRSD